MYPVCTLYRVRSLALQPLSDGNSAEVSQVYNLKTIQRIAMKLTPLASLGFCESIFVHFNTTEVESHDEGNHFKDDRNIKLAQ